MAEAVGAVASIVGIVAFGQQIIQATLKIKQLYADVKHAPTEVQELLEEIEDLCNIMDHLSVDEAVDAGQLADFDCVKKSHDLCRRAAERILGLAKELQEKMRARRYLGSVKMIIKRRDMEGMFTRLNRCKADLHLAHSIFASARQKRQHEEMIEQLAALKPQPRSTTITTVSDLALSKKSSVVARGSVRWLHIQFPRWFSQYACDIFFERASGCWTTTFKTYRVLPWKGEVWWMCLNGDINGIRNLLVRRELSIYDVFGTVPVAGSSRNVTLWGLSTEQHQSHLAQFLRQQGSQPSWEPRVVRLWDGTIYIEGFWNARLTAPDEYLSVVRSNAHFLLENNFEDDDECVKALLEAFAKEPSCLTTNERLLIFGSAPWGGTEIMFPLWETLMGKTIDDATFFHRLASTRSGFFNVIAKCWATDIDITSTVSQHVDVVDLTPWSRLLTQAFKCGVDLHHLNTGFTPLETFSRLLSSLDVYVRENHILHWLSTLAKAGADMEQYVATERSLVELEDYESRWDPFRDWIGITGFENGPEPSDWNIWYRNTTDIYAGEFWDMIEHPERAVPGAWLNKDRGQ